MINIKKIDEINMVKVIDEIKGKKKQEERENINLYLFVDDIL